MTFADRRWQLHALLATALATGCGDAAPSAVDTAVPFSSEERAVIYALRLAEPPPSDPTNASAEDNAAARLGQFIFFDRRFSGSGQVACATCHDPQRGFDDGQLVGRGIGQLGRHTPGLINVAYSRWFFWDGRADTLWAQALGPLEHPLEHGGSRLQYAHLVARDPALRLAYEGVFGPLPLGLADLRRFPPEGRPVADDPTHPHQISWATVRAADQQLINRIYTNLGKAIAAYERRLVGGDSAFDRFVRGVQTGVQQDVDALSPAAQRGLKLFIGEAECIRCHNGPLLTDGEFHNIGLGKRFWLQRGDEARFAGVDALRRDVFNSAGPYSDLAGGNDQLRFARRNTEQVGQFKTPTLRNLVLTPPYMHGGHFESLADALTFYSTLGETAWVGYREEVLLPLSLREEQIADLVAFLESLTSEPLAPALLAQPTTPVL